MSKDIFIGAFTSKNGRMRGSVYGENDFDDGGEGFVKS